MKHTPGRLRTVPDALGIYLPLSSSQSISVPCLSPIQHRHVDIRAGRPRGYYEPEALTYYPYQVIEKSLHASQVDNSIFQR